VFLYFDNDQKSAAPADARRLMRCSNRSELIRGGRGAARHASRSAAGMPGLDSSPRPFFGLIDDPQERAQDVGDPESGRSRHDQWRRLGGAFEQCALPLQLLGRQCVGFAQRHDLGFFVEPLPIGGKLRAYGLVGYSRMLKGAVDKMQERAAALDVAEKT